MAIAQSRQVYYKPASQFHLGAIIFLLLIVFAVLTRKLMDKEVGLAPLYLLSVIQLAPILVSTARKKFNYISFILFNHFFSYSIHKFNQFIFNTSFSGIHPEALLAIQELTTSTILIIAGYYLARFFLPSKRSNEPFQLLSLKRWQLLTVSLYVIVVPIFLSYIPSWYLAIHFTIMGADMMLLLSSNSPGHERLASFLKAVVFLSTIWFFLNTGMLALIGVLAAYVFIAACIRRKASFFILPIFLTIVGSAIQTVKFEYRNATSGIMGLSTWNRIEILAGLLHEKFSSGDATLEPMDDNIESLNSTSAEDKLIEGFSRVGDDSLERVLAWTPKKVPFWGGETYGHIPFIFIPRVLWPDKPSRHLWHKFGHVYGYLGKEDKSTSVSVTYLAEAYMNFGFPGMYTVAFGFGIFVWLIEAMSSLIFKGNFAFTFMVFLIPLQWYATDLGTIVNSVFIMTTILILFRSQILSMARNDVYSGVPLAAQS